MKMTKMKKAMMLMLLACLGTGCSDRACATRLIKTPIDSSVSMLFYTNSHGGFHGDGDTWCVFQFSDKQLADFLDVVRKRKGWHRLPATGDALTAMLRMEPAAVTNLQEGFYFFRDLQKQWDFQWANHNSLFNDDAKKLIDNRHSYNYVIAVLNVITRRLYIYNNDT